MLRNLFLASLTALLLAALAPGAEAARGTATRKKTDPASQAPPPAAPEAKRPLRPTAPVKKKVVVKARSRASAAKRRVARRLHGAVINHGLIRQSWTIADLNPMPALLDLDDTAKRMRVATAELVRLLRR